MLSSSRPVSCFDHRFLRVRVSLFLGSPPTAADQESGPLGQRQWEEIPEIKRLHSMVETVVVKPTKSRITRGLPQPASPNCRVTLPQPASPGRVAVWSLSCVPNFNEVSSYVPNPLPRVTLLFRVFMCFSTERSLGDRAQFSFMKYII